MNLKNLSSNVKIKTEKIKTMNINSNTSVEVYPGSIDLKSFSSSNIILPNWETGAYSAPYQYVLPDGSTLLQTFSGLNRSGQPYTKVGDIWFKNYISLLPDKTAYIITDAKSLDQGSLTLQPGKQAQVCYLRWIAADVGIPGNNSTLTGTYEILSSTPLLAKTNDDDLSIKLKNKQLAEEKATIASLTKKTENLSIDSKTNTKPVASSSSF